jgi:hypothetical protein
MKPLEVIAAMPGGKSGAVGPRASEIRRDGHDEGLISDRSACKRTQATAQRNPIGMVPSPQLGKCPIAKNDAPVGTLSS